MIVRPLAALLTFVLASALPALAEDSLSFDDPGMHFKPSADWTRIDPDPSAGQNSGGNDAPQEPPAAVFLYHKGARDQRSILIQIKSYQGNLEDLERAHESDLRHIDDSTFVKKRTKTALANGMPAYFIQFATGRDAGTFMRRYEYLVYDGQRSIEVTFSGREGDVTDSDAQNALESLYVVAYPARRP